MSFDRKLAKRLKHRWSLRWWMLRYLPMGGITGMYIRRLDEAGCEVVLKDRWWLRNPYRSVFWAVSGMAAELSTGAILYANASGTGIKFILVSMDAHFFKKVRGKSYYFAKLELKWRKELKV